MLKTHSFVTTDMAAESLTSSQEFYFSNFLFFAATKAAGNCSRISLKYLAVLHLHMQETPVTLLSTWKVKNMYGEHDMTCFVEMSWQ